MSTPTIVNYIPGGTSGVSLITTEANALANNVLVISSVGGTSGVFNNAYSGGGIGGWPWARAHLHLGIFGSTPTANSGVDVWFLCAADGTNYESGSSSITPARAPDFTFPVIAQTAAQDVELVVPLPYSANFKVLIRNNGTGQSFAATGNTIAIYATTNQIPSI